MTNIVLEREFKMNVEKWFADNAEEKRYDYPLNENSVVLDIGFYKGEFTKKIFEKYNCSIYGFEPVTPFFFEGWNNIPRNNKIRVFNFGVSDHSGTENIYISNDESSTIRRVSKNMMKINILEFDKIITNMLGSVTIDLCKINIEGEEYQLLNHIINTGHIKLIKNLQIQFHIFVNDAEKKRDKIREKLSIMHDVEWEYKWVWESWKRKEIK